jgi:hypothetical protein
MQKITDWVTRTIRGAKKPDPIFHKFLEIAEHLATCCFLNSAFAILEGLKAENIPTIPTKDQSRIHELLEIFSPDGDFRNCREKAKSLNPPIIPYIGVSLCDMISARAWNPAKFPNGSTCLIDFTKAKKVYDVVKFVQTLQTGNLELRGLFNTTYIGGRRREEEVVP